MPLSACCAADIRAKPNVTNPRAIAECKKARVVCMSIEGDRTAESCPGHQARPSLSPTVPRPRAGAQAMNEEEQQAEAGEHRQSDGFVAACVREKALERFSEEEA